MTAAILIHNLDMAACVDALPADEFPLFEIVEENDEDTCDLCLEEDGKTISRDDRNFEDVTAIPHINCRRTIAGISKDEVGPDGNPVEPNYEPPPAHLVEKHGHFMVNREKYAPLRIMAQPEGRDFVARPVVDKHGKTRLRLDWRIPEYEIPGYEAPQ
jgi:hypothetical protein